MGRVEQRRAASQMPSIAGSEAIGKCTEREEKEWEEWLRVLQRQQRAIRRLAPAPGGGQGEICYRYNQTRECRVMLVCHRCRGMGHLHWECPRGDKRDRGLGNLNHDKRSQAGQQTWAVANEEKAYMMGYHRALMGCLIGQSIRGNVHGELRLEELRMGVEQKIPTLKEVELYYLVTGMFLIRGVSTLAYITASRWTQEFKGGMMVKWRCVLLTNGATLRDWDTIMLEVWDILLGYRSRPALEALVKPFGMLCRVITDGLVEGVLTLSYWRQRGPWELSYQVKDCREPIKCLECGQSGHRRTSCPHQSPQP